jgi:tetratricopeptide (TPR) repeat protein
MRKAIDQLRKLIVDFIEQRDDLMLVLACPPAEGALMLNLLLGLESDRQVDLYYLFAEDFASTSAYLDAIAHRLKTDYDASVESEGPDEEPLPPVPAKCLAAAESAPSRLHAALAYTRSLVPASTGHRIVWGLGPAEIANVGDYTALLLSCLPTPKIEPWMRGLRMIVRVPADLPDTDPLAKAPRVRFQRFAIPPDAAESELKAIVANERLPDAERIQALLQLSFIDAAHDRLPAATQGFNAALAFYQSTNDPTQQALAMIGLADCSRRGGDVAKAKYWYECAIIQAGEENQLMLLSLIAQHLGAIAFDAKQYDDAVSYYDELVTLKRAITDEEGLIDALLWRGRAQEKAAQRDAALVSWEEAMLICKTFEVKHREEECLTQLKHGFAALGRAADGDRAVAEWKNA